MNFPLVQGQITRPTPVRSPNERIRVFLSPSDPLLVGKYHAQAKHIHVVCDSKNGAFSIALPDLRMCEVQEFIVYNAPSSGAGNIVTITGTAMEGGGTSHALNPGDTVTLVSDLKTRWLLSDVNTGPWEPAITPGTTGQYWRGDKTWQALPSGIGGSGTLGTIPLWTPDGSHLGDSLLSQTATGINLTLAGTPAAANNMLTMLSTVDTGGVTGTELLISTKQRKSGVDYDVCAFGGIAEDTYADASHRNGAFTVSAMCAGSLQTRLSIYGDNNTGNYGGMMKIYESDDFLATIVKTTLAIDAKCYGFIHPFQKDAGGLMIEGFSKYGDGITLQSRCCDGGGAAAFKLYANFINPTTGIGGRFADTSLLFDLSDVCGGGRTTVLGDGTLQLHFSTLAHGMTDYLPTTAWGSIGPMGAAQFPPDHDPMYGGLHIIGAAGGIGPGIMMHAIGASSCSVNSMLDIIVGHASGTGITAIGALEKVIRILNGTLAGLEMYGDLSVRMPGALGVGTSTPTTAGRIQCSENLLAGGDLKAGTAAANVTEGDFFVDSANKTVYVGRLSGTSGNSSDFIIRNRINAPVFKYDHVAGSITLSPDGGGVTIASAFGCNGAAAQATVSVNAACDITTVVALCNQLRGALVANGICT